LSSIPTTTKKLKKINYTKDIFGIERIINPLIFLACWFQVYPSITIQLAYNASFNLLLKKKGLSLDGNLQGLYISYYLMCRFLMVAFSLPH
jgi:hypothetical protein